MSRVATAVWQAFLAEHGDGRAFDAVVTEVLPFGARVPGLLPGECGAGLRMPDAGAAACPRIRRKLRVCS